MGVDEGDLQIIDVDMTLKNCSVTIVILNLLVYGTKQYSTKVISCSRTRASDHTLTPLL